MNRKIRIGCWSAFWGDSPFGAHQLVKQGENLQYIVGDYLSEVTMGILARSKDKSSSEVKGGMGEGGFIQEFITSICEPLLPLLYQKKITVITNAGGMNPLACKAAVEKCCAKNPNFLNIKVAAVYGDDITKNLKDFKLQNFTLEDEEKIPQTLKVMSANVYVGALPIVSALQQGAQIIVTGRVVDSALTLAPLMFEFGWTTKDYDLLAAGSLAGHIIECGTQATGGNFTDWRESFRNGWDNVGYPVVECSSDGSFIVSKPSSTGGCVTIGSVGEQMVYEIHDPGNYILPDVILDFRNVKLEQVGKDLVKVSGARGRPPTASYKVSMTFLDGYTVSGSLLVGGIDALQKGKAVAFGILTKVRRILTMMGLKDFDDVNVEFLGSECIYGPHSRLQHSREVIVRISVKHSNPKAIGLFAKELAPAATSMAPGITGSGGGRPKATPTIVYASSLVAKDQIPISVNVAHDFESTSLYLPLDVTTKIRPSLLQDPDRQESTLTADPSKSTTIGGVSMTMVNTVPLVSLCLGRSGDKGDVANIGIICRNPEHFEYVKQHLTARKVKDYMQHIVKGRVVRYELPGISAFNFVLTKSLGGGGLSSLQVDRQGKCLAQMLLDIPIQVPFEWLPKLITSRL